MAHYDTFWTDGGFTPVDVYADVSVGAACSQAIKAQTDVTGGAGVRATGDGTNGYGVRAYATGTGGIGLYARSSAGDAVYATTNGTTAHAIQAFSFSNNGYPTIYAENTDNALSAPGRFAIGARCTGTSGTPSTAIHGQSSGLYGYGVQGVAPSTGGIGVCGSSNGTGVVGLGLGVGSSAISGLAHDSNPGTYAGYFSGPVYMSGPVTKPAGAFLIDHPLDPENKTLRHSFVESPDMKNIYDGLGVADSNGEITVQMPEYFDALNKDIRYQLTAIGAPAPGLHVKHKLTGGWFTIAGAVAGQEVSWFITGVRRDAFAEANPMLVEEEKTPEQRGLYLQPAAYGLPPDRGIDWERIQRAKQETPPVMSGESPNPPSDTP